MANTTNVTFLAGTASGYANIESKDLIANVFYFCTDTNELYIGGKKLTNAADLASAVSRIGSLETLTEKLDGADSVTGSIKQQIKAAIEALDGSASIATVSQGVVTLKAGITEADGVVSNSNDSDITLAKVATTGSGADVSIDAQDAGTTATTVQAAVKELKGAITSLNTDSVVTLEEAATATTSMFKTYNFYQGDISDASKKAAAFVGKIDIPKDFLVKSGKVVTVSSGTDSDGDSTEVADGTYLKLVLNSKDGQETSSAVYINVVSLVDVYTAAQNATEVQLAVNNYVLSASVVDVDAGKVTYIAADSTADPAVARESVKAALQRLDGDSSTTGSVAKKIADAIGALDATVSIVDAGDTNPLNITITQADGVITGVTGSIDANTFDAYGSAAAVLGTNADDSEDTTVYGAFAAVNDLADYVGTIPKKGGEGADKDDPVAADVISYVDMKTGAGIDALDGTATIASKSGNAVTIKAGIVEANGVISNSSDTDITLADVASTGAAANVSIADAGSIYTATTVEAALQEVKGIADATAAAIQWGSF